MLPKVPTPTGEFVTPQSFRRPRTVLVALVALVRFVGVPVTSAVTKSHGHHDPTIAEVRAMPLGTTVTVEGTVTTPAGVFDSSFFDVGFAIQDSTAGVFISFPDPDQTAQPLRKARPPLHVEVTGVLQDEAGLLVITPASPKDVDVKGKDEPIGSAWVRTGTVGESTEGLLVRAVGVITQGPIPDEPFGNKFLIDDGSDHFEIDIRSSADLEQPVR